MRTSRYIGAVLAPAAVLASRYTVPAPTAVVAPDPVEGFSPKVTGGARVGNAAIDLLKRYVDYDQTCGFVNGDLESALTCAGTYICATNTILDVAGCCDPLSLDSCSLYTSCVPSAQLVSCTAADCLLDDAVAKCTDASAPYCVDWKHDYVTTTLAGYGCDVSAFTGTVALTYSGQDIFDISSYLSSIPEFSFPTVYVTQTQVLSKGGGSLSTSSSSSPNSSNDSKSSTPIGAIVGGVVGGLGALAVVGAVVLFCLFKKRRDKRNAAAAAAFQPAQPQQSGPPPPAPMQYGAPAPGYKPPLPSMGGVPQTQQQQQQQQQQPGNFYAAPAPPAGAGDVKYEYTQQTVSSVPSTPGPYSPPLSPSPPYSQPTPPQLGQTQPPPPPPPPSSQQQQQQQHQRWNSDIPQIDGTPVHNNSEGQQVHEAP